MVALAVVRGRRVAYAVGWDDADGWTFERAEGGRAARYPLAVDRRHARFFLRPADERRVGPEGVAALERLARRLLG